jgi:phosphoglycolate phosphatase
VGATPSTPLRRDLSDEARPCSRPVTGLFWLTAHGGYPIKSRVHPTRENTQLVLLLFDIDGTLLQGAAVEHAQAMYVALHEVYGLGEADGNPRALPAVQVAGRTDLEIAREIALLCGRSAEAFQDGKERFSEVCVREYSLRVPADLSDRIVSGMDRLVAELDQTTGVQLSLVTGNLEGIARIKLARAGLGSYFPSGQGGFGSDSEDRTDLPAIARRRAGEKDRPYLPQHTLVIGDTPKDIACAQADGVRCIAVTTGPYKATDLTGADAVAVSVGDLRELILDQLRTSRL